MTESSDLGYVTKLDGSQQLVDLEKLTRRIKNLCYDLNLDFINPSLLATRISSGMINNMSTTVLDDHAANFISSMSVDHPDFGLLAGRIHATSLHKRTYTKFSDSIKALRDNVDRTGKQRPLIAEDVYEIVMENRELLDSSIVPERDLDFTYFGFRTLERAYLLRTTCGKIETPQFMYMRVAIGIHKQAVKEAIETYNLMSQRFFTHATPTLFNAGTPRPQLSSCFLLSPHEDSVDGVFKALYNCAMISRFGGGIGFNIHNLRALNSSIEGNPGKAEGILPVLQQFNSTATYVNQGGKRPGAFAIYLEPWHADIMDFVQLRLNVGPEEKRCRDLFIALWVPDLFMKRVEADDYWSLMSPDECPGLDECWGEKFEELYEGYEAQSRYRTRIKARSLWRTILSSQCETGLPYLLYKDSCNRKSNQQNLGTIKCSNLCTEIVEYTSKDEVAVCNLASIALNRFVKEEGNGAFSYDFEKLRQISKLVARNLNKVIDINFYPIPEAKKSNFRHRPIGIGVQGLADAFMLMRFPFTSPEARNLNKKIFETIYFGALEASNELAQEFGPYESYKGSPISKGIFQFNMWPGTQLSTELNWDWTSLRQRIQKYGVRNSLLVAPMPTASTAQILGNNEAFEPYTSNFYTRRVARGDFQVVNQHLIRDLLKLNLWDAEMRDRIIMENGSVQRIDELPQHLKDLYKTVWEIKQLDLIQMAADRGPFIDQSQSMNLFVESPTYSKCTTMHFKSWKLGLKTGMYYLRSKPSVNPVKFTIKRNQLSENQLKRNGSQKSQEEEEEVKNGVFASEECVLDDEGGCEMCSG